ncbi:negative elongation factor E isoform X2 [Palaemon carinicauda]|uniref:negative elongation factor E isoform X1 n=1 Tax=Palaemon carinicauda TaxID=392227 RepID=UPI0035B5C7ED
MVYLHFPSNLTEEEQMLQAKYQKLRRKKKALQALKAPKQEPEPLVPLKRPMEAKDAKEMAKKLIKSGAIKVPERSQAATEKTTFKRSMGLERKLSAAEKAPSGYQPFSTTHPEEEIHESRVKVKQNLYDSFVTARDREERGEFTRDGRGSDGKPRHGHTIYVFGYNISEEVLKKAFATFGNIVNVNMEIEKHCGFVTFDKVESAEKAISDMNGSIVRGIQLKVSLARRQPVIDPINDASSSATWSTIAASHSQKGSHKDKRDLVAYDVDFFG